MRLPTNIFAVIVYAMAKRNKFEHPIIIFLCLSALFAVAFGTRGDTPLTAEAIIQRTVERSEGTDSRESQENYTFRKRTTMEGLDSKGRVTERKEKLYDVLVKAGVPKLTLLQIDGKTPPPKELKKEAERDAAERASYSRDSKKDKKKKKEEQSSKLATAELTARYQFVRLEDEPVNGRVAFVLTFAPKTGKLPEHELTDRFLNHMAGKVWIDAEDFELVRADIHLQSEITLWGGVLGKLRRCEFGFTRARQPDGVWVELSSNGLFEGRKLLESMAIKTTSESMDFKPMASAER